MNKGKTWRLHTNCIPVKGARRSVICDIQRSLYKYIPNALYDILTSNNSFSLNNLAKKYGEENRSTLEGYFHFLMAHDFITNVILQDQFPEISREWQSPSTIENAIIDSDSNSVHNFAEIINELTDLGCQHVQLRFFDIVDLETLKNTLEVFTTTSIYSIQLLLKYQEKYSPEDYFNLIRKELRITDIIIHSSPTSGLFEGDDTLIKKNALYYSSQKIKSEQHCGEVHEAYFTVNSSLFRESEQFNSCLNKKISIDKKGNIKNCPSLPKSYGKFGETTLTDALHIKSFKEKWGIHKDLIQVCQDCEFRHICTDCRAYTEEDDELGKPLKCNYDPYTAVWE